MLIKLYDTHIAWLIAWLKSGDQSGYPAWLIAWLKSGGCGMGPGVASLSLDATHVGWGSYSIGGV